MNNLKLTMNDDYSFQKMIGYHDDPAMMTTDDVQSQLSCWADIVGKILDGETINTDYLSGLDGFLKSLSDIADIRYEHPIPTYEYHAGFELYSNFYVRAGSQDEADEKAKVEFSKRECVVRRIKDSNPIINVLFDGVWSYLERNDGSGFRLIED